MMTEQQAATWATGVLGAALGPKDRYPDAVNDFPDDDDKNIVLAVGGMTHMFVQATKPKDTGNAFAVPVIPDNATEAQRLTLQLVAAVANEDVPTASALAWGALTSEAGAEVLADAFVILSMEVCRAIRTSSGLNPNT